MPIRNALKLPLSQSLLPEFVLLAGKVVGLMSSQRWQQQVVLKQRLVECGGKPMIKMVQINLKFDWIGESLLD